MDEKPKKRKAKKVDCIDYKCGPTQSIFTPDFGEVEGPINCGLCNTEMLVTRDCNGPRGWAAAMSGSKSCYDFFHCPHRQEKWHIQAERLRENARSTPSGKLEAMFLEEALEIIGTRTCTKESGLIF